VRLHRTPPKTTKRDQLGLNCVVLFVKLRTRVLLLALLAGFFALPAASASATDPASVTLTMNKSVYVAGDSAEFTSTITATNLDWVVSVQFPGSTDWKPLCVQYNVNDSVQHCTLGVYYNAKVKAVLVDDKGTATTTDDTVEAAANLSVPVRAAMGILPLDYFTKSGNYAVESNGSSPSFRGASYPAFPGKRCLRHVVQRRYSSGWKRVLTSACMIEQKQGQVVWRWSGRHPSRVNFRVRSTFAGDSVNQAANSSWLYFRFR
jgi:hypothetical protein